MTFCINDYKIWVDRNILKIFDSFKQIDNSMNEAGGILLGQIKGKEIFILKASIPNKFDKATRCSFERNKEAAQVIVDYEFINSEQRTIYIGEWHTHPENIPEPSNQDKRMIKNQFSKNIKNEDFILLVIIGLEKIFACIIENGNNNSVLIDFETIDN